MFEGPPFPLKLAIKSVEHFPGVQENCIWIATAWRWTWTILVFVSWLNIMLYAENQIFFCLLKYQFVLTTTAQSALFFTAQKPSSLQNGTLNFAPELYQVPLGFG